MCSRNETARVDLANGSWHLVDRCIAPIVQALNDAGYLTVSSCCGHGWRPGSIIYRDGGQDREALLMGFDEARRIDWLWPGINGEPATLEVRERERVSSGSTPDS